MKTYVLIVSNNFMSKHPRKGEPTNFEEKILSGEKIHTIRGNLDYWKKIIEEVNAGKAILSLRKWNGKPYNSKQTEIKQFTKLGFQEVCITVRKIITGDLFYATILLENTSFGVSIETLAKNDGLEKFDFEDWFTESFSGIIIHFTDFRY